MDNPKIRRALIAATIVAALVLVPVAEAHITVTPTSARPGSDQVLTFTVPNEREHAAITRVIVAAARWALFVALAAAALALAAWSSRSAAG